MSSLELIFLSPTIWFAILAFSVFSRLLIVLITSCSVSSFVLAAMLSVALCWLFDRFEVERLLFVETGIPFLMYTSGAAWC